MMLQLYDDIHASFFRRMYQYRVSASVQSHVPARRTTPAKSSGVLPNRPQLWTAGNTKPKQGTPFRVDRSKMLNCSVDPSEEELVGWSGASDDPIAIAEAEGSIWGVCVMGDG